jgi:hypothetical protein
MTVPVSKRGNNPLSVLLEADNLVTYTMRICTNEKKFPKRYRWCITSKIIEAAIETAVNVSKADSVYIEDQNSYNLRRDYQRKAVASIDSLLTLMDIAFRAFEGLRSDETGTDEINITYWVGQADKVKTLLLAWKKSDKETFKRFTMGNGYTPNSGNGNNVRYMNPTGNVNNNNAYNGNGVVPDCVKASVE